MNWYTKLANQTWTVRCPKCHKEWAIEQNTPGWISAREKQLQGRQAEIVCKECLRSKKPSK